MPKQVSLSEMDAHYTLKHRIRAGMYNKPYANFGYWPRSGMTIDDACDAMADLMAKELDVTHDDSILECGCGYGTSAAYIATHYHPKNITGIDVTHIRIQSGQELVREKGLESSVKIMFGDASKLAFDNESFTKVMAIECAFHFDTRFDFFREAFRVLKPGGKMALADIIIAPEIDVSSKSFDELRDFISADKSRYCDANLYNADTYAKLLEKAGFSNVRIYSIKDQVVLQYAEHVLGTAEVAPPEERERRIRGVNALKDKFMLGGDYIIAVAHKGEVPRPG